MRTASKAETDADLLEQFPWLCGTLGDAPASSPTATGVGMDNGPSDSGAGSGSDDDDDPSASQSMTKDFHIEKVFDELEKKRQEWGVDGKDRADGFRVRLRGGPSLIRVQGRAYDAFQAQCVSGRQEEWATDFHLQKPCASMSACSASIAPLSLPGRGATECSIGSMCTTRQTAMTLQTSRAML